MDRRRFVACALAVFAAPPVRSLAMPGGTAGERLAAAARAQLGVTDGYDPGYTRIPYPGGDVRRSTGVCADVVVRAARDGLGLDLQRLVHEDMARDFAAYPRTWGLHAPDSNIDHRRVLNLEVFWRRQHAELWAAKAGVPTAGDGFPGDLQPGDELTWLLGGRLPHVGIVVQNGTLVPRVVHNIGGGVQESPLSDLRAQQAKGHFRWPALSIVGNLEPAVDLRPRLP